MNKSMNTSWIINISWNMKTSMIGSLNKSMNSLWNMDTSMNTSWKMNTSWSMNTG
jgi:hypothetical protein